MFKKFAIPFLIASFFASCGSTEQRTTETVTIVKHDSVDSHTHARPGEARVTHLDLDIAIDFDSKTIEGTATWTISHDTADSVVFDISNLHIVRVTLDNGEEAKFHIGDSLPWVGRPLSVALKPGTQKVTVSYKTRPDAEALQWLEPEQTLGKTLPFLYTQSEAIMARTWLPCQDSPGIKYTYTATVKVDTAFMVVMSASNPVEKQPDGTYRFEMNQPIPSYLMALAAGDLAFAPIGERTGVYAEPAILDKAVYEFGDTEKMIEAAENLYGPYRWERYDILVLPPSFPFGGMENPRLTFVTPTILAGDRSLVSLIAHELAHSWSGNLVTNATWDDFWLNEGFTVYLERRIMDSIYGVDYTNMLRVLGYQDLEHALEELPPEDTRLKLDLQGRNPDDGMSDIAYEKGALFLQRIADVYGSREMDEFLKKYFDDFAFDNLTTEDFITYLDSHLIVKQSGKRFQVEPEVWIYEPGLPGNAPEPTSSRLGEVSSSLKAWTDGSFTPEELNTGHWTAHEWIEFIRKLPDTLSSGRLEELDKAFHFTQSNNNEILAIWLEQSIKHNYHAIDGRLDTFLGTVGRRKFLVPLYKALLKSDPEKAKSTYAKYRKNYHAVSRETLDKLLGYNHN